MRSCLNGAHERAESRNETLFHSCCNLGHEFLRGSIASEIAGLCCRNVELRVGRTVQERAYSVIREHSAYNNPLNRQYRFERVTVARTTNAQE